MIYVVAPVCGLQRYGYCDDFHGMVMKNDLHVTDDTPSRMRAPRVSASVSLNYSVAKVIAIFTVLAGHWFTGTILWIPVTFGLFIFAFSSGYFTSRIYGDDIDRKKFWRKKLERLWLRYWVILIFLTLVVALKGGTVWHPHTLVHFFGLSGVLNWFFIRNGSGLGAGLWFFTLLLIFYLAYPSLAAASRSKRGALALSASASAAALFLADRVVVGHELWLTALGFILGVAYGAHEPRLKAASAAAAAIAGCGVLLVLNAAGHKGLNTAMIAAVSAALAMWLSKAKFPEWKALASVAKLEKYLLEIFLIHVYLFVHPTGNAVADLALSVALVLAVAVVLYEVAQRLATRVFAPPALVAEG